MDRTYIQALMEVPASAGDISFQDAGKRALPRVEQQMRDMLARIRERYTKPMRRWCRANRLYQFGAKIGVLTRTMSTKRAKIYRRQKSEQEN